MADQPTSGLERPHILIVSDDLDLCQFLAEGLVYGGFWTSTIASALQTLEVFRLRTFDVALVDAELQGMAAPELIRRLRGRTLDREQVRPITDIPLLVITGSETEAETFRREGAGEDAVLQPPIDLEELVPRLHQIVRDWRAAHPGRPWADEAAQRPAKATDQ
jgi:DNA-binding response OmpR family regulator